MAYDPKCYELAEYFLESVARDTGKEVDAAQVAALAQDIQDAVENFFEYEKGNN